jgi:hypothetical protein
MNTRRELLVTFSARPAAGPEEWLGDERRLLAEAGVLDRDTGRWQVDLGSLDDDGLRRLEILLRAAREHDTRLTLDVRIAPDQWTGPTVAWPVAHGWPPIEVDSSGMHTLLLIDVQHTREGPTHHWWLGAEPPCGTYPDPEAACQVLRSFRDDEDPFAFYDGPVLEVELGDGHATVRGFWRGRWREGVFGQSDSGEDTRWGRLGAVLEP